jgi:hypothetical protein
MNALQKFFQDGLADQLLTAGELVTLINPKSKEATSFNAVITQTNGETTVEIGGITYAVTAHILIPYDYTPTVGNLIKHRGNEYKIITAVRSPFDAAYSCSLLLV